MAGVLIKRGLLDTDTHRERRLCEDKCGNQGDASISQRTPKIASKPPESGGGGQRVDSPQSLRRSPANILISDFQPPELGEIFLLF